MLELKKYFPSAKFIHVIRDGRDVAISKAKLGWAGTKSKRKNKQLVFGALSWEKSVLFGNKYGRTIGDSYLEIRYEDIICDTKKAVDTINKFLNTNF